MPSPTSLTLDAPNAQAPAIQRAAEILRRGGVVVFPTETVYGVAASVIHAAALERLRIIKSRPDQKPFTLHLGDPAQIARYVDVESSPVLRQLIRKTMPGPITFVVDVDDATIARKLAGLNLPAEVGARLYHENTIGIRCPDDAIAQAVLNATGEPVVASSANLAGAAEATDARMAAASLGDRVDLILDGGVSRYARASTIVRIQGRKAQVLREGVYDRRYLARVMQQSILFVCSGNTCRSAMAEAIARHELAGRLGVDPRNLSDEYVGVQSAGAFATPGTPMTPEAAEALAKLGIPTDPHVSRSLSPDLVRQADAIFCMTHTHRDALLDMNPEAAGKAQLLDPQGDVDDPIGASLNVYVQCARHIRELIRHRLDELGFTAASGPQKH